MADDNYLTISKAADILKVHPETLRRWDKDGTLRAVRVNERGDRRWRKVDVITYMQTKSTAAGFNNAMAHGEYEIIQVSNGFEMFSNRFGLTARYVAQSKESQVGFVFAAAGLDLMAEVGEHRKDLSVLAEETIKKKLSEDEVSDDDIYTFEYMNGKFIEVEFPDWFDVPLHITLAKNLRAEKGRVHLVAPNVEAWRVIVVFKCLQNSKWLRIKLGNKPGQYEYFVEVSAEYLEDHAHLPSNERGAAIFALIYVRNRYQETREADGERSLERISDTRVACWGGKCRIGEYLPIKKSDVV